MGGRGPDPEQGGSAVSQPPSFPGFNSGAKEEQTAPPRSRKGLGPAPSPRQARAPAGLPSLRLTRLPVDLDVEVALRPVLRPHRYRGGGESWEKGGGKVVRTGARAGAGAEPEPRAPRASRWRPRGRVRTGPPPAPGLPAPRWRAHAHAGELFTWLASSLNSSPCAEEKARPQGREPNAANGPPPPSLGTASQCHAKSRESRDKYRESPVSHPVVNRKEAHVGVWEVLEASSLELQ